METLTVSTIAPDQTQSTELLGKLDSLFNDLAGLMGADANNVALKSGMSQQAAINESTDLAKNVEVLTQKDGLKNELSLIQQREEDRLSHVRAQNVLISRRKEKISGTSGYSRDLDDVVQVRVQKKTGPISAPAEDEVNAEEQLLLFDLERSEDIERASQASPDFSEAFLGASHHSSNPQEEENAPPQAKHPLKLEKDEILNLKNTNTLETHFEAHLNASLNPRTKPEPITNHDIERRIERIGRFINKPVAGKAFAVPTTKSVARLRSKFGKM